MNKTANGKSKYITRTFSTNLVRITSPGKPNLEIETVNPATAIDAYCLINDVDKKNIKVEVIETESLYRMEVATFLQHAEKVVPADQKADGGNK